MSPRVSEAHKRHRRKEILDAALEVFIGKGYQVATINDIAARGGMSVGAIYRYFRTKGEIMLTLVEERLGATPEILARLTRKAGDPWERLERCVDIFAGALRVRHPATGRLLLVTLAEAVQDGEVRKGVHDRFRDLTEYLREVVHDGIRQGLFRADLDPVALVSLLVCMADGLTVYWVIDTPGVELRSLRNTALAMVKEYARAKE